MSYKLSDGTEVTKETPEDVIQSDVILRVNKDFQKYLTLWRNSRGVAKTPEGGMYSFGINGQADASGIIKPGIRLEIEFKRKGKKQSKAQVKFQKMIEKHGGIYLLCDGNYNDQIFVPLMTFISVGRKPYE